MGKAVKKCFPFFIIYLIPFSLGAIFAVFLLDTIKNSPTHYPNLDIVGDNLVANEYDEYLLLINHESSLEASYVPPDLTPLSATRKDGRKVQFARAECAYALEKMIDEMKKDGVWDEKLSVTSAYRSYEYQEYLFNVYVENRIKGGMNYDEAYKDVKKSVALAGHSEHQSGLCVDFHNKSYANTSFAETEQYKWIEQNAHRFGFIIRYSKGKEQITKISFEPWHLRYVTPYHATQMYENNLCLEEYRSACISNK